MTDEPNATPPGRHRPAPRELRHSSRTHWHALKVGSYVMLELAVAALLVFALVWLLAHS